MELIVGTDLMSILTYFSDAGEKFPTDRITLFHLQSLVCRQTDKLGFVLLAHTRLKLVRALAFKALVWG